MLIGVLFGAAYASVIWLEVLHPVNDRGMGWNALIVPLILGGVALAVLIIGVLMDALGAPWKWPK